MKISGGGYKVGRRCWLQEVQEDRSSIDSFHWSRGRCGVLMSMSSPIFNIYSWAQIKFAIKYAVCEIVDGLQSRMKLIFCRCVIYSFSHYTVNQQKTKNKQFKKTSWVMSSYLLYTQKWGRMMNIGTLFFYLQFSYFICCCCRTYSQWLTGRENCCFQELDELF